MTRVKVCGITNVEDALAAAECGADALGFVFAESPRRVRPDTVRRITARLPPFVKAVAVFVNPSLAYIKDVCDATGIDTVQLHGNESPSFCRRLRQTLLKRLAPDRAASAGTLRDAMKRYRPSAFIIDPGCGSGRSFDWAVLNSIKERFIIAGGLTPVNVRRAIQTCRPYGVDVCSGVESTPGRKDWDKLRAFTNEVKACF